MNQIFTLQVVVSPKSVLFKVLKFFPFLSWKHFFLFPTQSSYLIKIKYIQGMPLDVNGIKAKMLSWN